MDQTCSDRRLPLAACVRRAVLTLLGLAFITSAGQAEAGPDRIVYTCLDEVSYDICVIDPDGGDPLDLTNTNLVSEKGASFSPDGSKIAFYADYTGFGRDLFVTLTSGSGAADNISQTDDRWEGPEPASWSPDGSRLTYEAYYPSSAPPNLGIDVLISPFTGTLDPVPFGSTQGQENFPEFSPDGTRIAYARVGTPGANGIMVGPADGSSPPAFLAGTGLGTRPMWSPDGSRILTAISPGSGARTIRVVRTDGSGTYVDLFSDIEVLEQYDWSPDGNRVVWVDNRNFLRINSASDPNSFIEIDAGDLVAIRDPQWSPDGARILFSALDPEADPPNFQLFAVNADGSGVPTAVTGLDVSAEEPSWMPRDVGLTGPTGSTSPTGSTGPTGPTGPTRPPKTVDFARFRGTVNWVPGTQMPIAFVDCNARGSKSVNPICRYYGTGKSGGLTTGRSGEAFASAGGRKTLIARGSLKVKSGKKKTLKMKPTKAGKRLLKPGRKIRMRVTIKQKIKGLKTRTMSKTVTVKVKRR